MESEHILQFPLDRPVGRILMRRADSTSPFDWQTFHEAIGDIEVPAEAQIGALIDLEAAQDPEAIEPINLSRLDFLAVSSWPLKELFAIDDPRDEEDLPQMEPMEWVFDEEAPPSTHSSLWSKISRCPRLHTLWLVNVSLLDEGIELLASLRQLREVRLSESIFTSCTMNWLGKMTGLRKLMLDGTKIEDVDLHAIRSLPELQRLSLRNTNITDAGLEHIQTIKTLVELDLSDTLISDKGLWRLSNMSELQKLYLDFTSIHGHGLEHLRGLGHLEELHLLLTMINDKGLEELKRFPSLRVLWILSRRISAEALEEFRQTYSSCEIRPL